MSRLDNSTVLSLVNDEPIRFEEFKSELQAFHLKNRKDIKTDAIDVYGFLDKLIRKKMFVQEAIRVGLDKSPEISLAVDGELKRIAVQLLHKEEIEDRVEVTDEEAWQEYKNAMENRVSNLEGIMTGITLDPNSHNEETEAFLSVLRDRASIQTDPNFFVPGARDPNEILVQVNNKQIRYARLKGGTNTQPDRSRALRFLINQELLAQESERSKPTRERFEKAKNRLKSRMVKDKIQKREGEYLQQLRKSAEIIIDHDALFSEYGDLKGLGYDPNGLEYGDPNYPVAFVNDEPITLGEVFAGLDLKDKMPREEDARDKMPREKGTKDEMLLEKNALKEKRVQYLIDCMLIDQEALARGYEERPNVRKRLKEKRYEAIYNKFLNELLIPSMGEIKGEEVKKYYDDHPDLFNIPVFIKAEEIRLSSQDEAEQIMGELGKGTDFSFLAKNSLSNRIKGNSWVRLENLDPAIGQALSKANEGDIIGPLSWQEGYSIFFLKRRRGGTPLPFYTAQRHAYQMLWQERYNKLISEWETILRDSSKIVIYDDRLKAIREGL